MHVSTEPGLEAIVSLLIGDGRVSQLVELLSKLDWISGEFVAIEVEKDGCHGICSPLIALDECLSAAEPCRQTRCLPDWIESEIVGC